MIAQITANDLKVKGITAIDELVPDNDGVIITVDSAISGPALGVYQEPEVFVSALAIKYVVPASTPSAK